MHYRKIVQAVNLEEAERLKRRDKRREPDESFPQLPYEGDKRLRRALETKSPQDISNYLGGWRLRVKIDLEKLKDAVESNKLQLQAISGIQLYNIDLDTRILIETGEVPLHDMILQLYDRFSNVGIGRRGYTLASHILSILVPEYSNKNPLTQGRIAQNVNFVKFHICGLLLHLQVVTPR